MPFATGGTARINTNIPAMNAYNALDASNRIISQAQLQLSTGKRINNAADDVAGYITSKALIARNGSINSALNTVGDAQNVSNITMDALDNINTLLTSIKDSTTSAASGALGTDEKVALAKAAFRMAQQIQTVVDSTVFGGSQLLSGGYTADFFIGVNSTNNLLTLSIDLSTSNADFNVSSNNFNVNSTLNNIFAGITDLNLMSLNDVSASNLGIFSISQISMTISSIADALNNVNKAATYLGGISNRLTSQQDLLQGQITNYAAAISRLQDTDVAQTQLNLVKSQFLQQASLVSLAQANQNPAAFLNLIKG